MTRRLRAALFTALMVASMLSIAPVAAHEMTMAEMDVRETAKGEFFWLWTANERRAGNEDLVPTWPDGCVARESTVRCGADGLRGVLAIDGIGRRYSAAIVKVHWLDGQSRVYTITAAQPAVRLYGSADDQRGVGEIASAYVVLGVEHILTGVDHLMFVIALLFLVGFERRLFWTITAFTAAHSLTLASAALGWLTLRSPPVEACIALSIVLVAAEALHRRQTLARRWPALVAFLFGLVHGLGFAGALKDIGLPENHLPVALLTFNVGVEIGQLGTVALAWLVWRGASRWPVLLRTRAALLYTIGSIAASWSLMRIVAIAG